MPSLVKTSNSSAWRTRPSRMWARPTPQRTACTEEATFGSIPPRSSPASTIASSSAADTAEISVAGSCSSRRRPSTSVRYTSFSASSADAIAPAAVSALMLYACPCASLPIVATTGTSSSVSSRRRMSGFTASTSPTNPSSGERALAVIRPASSPESPTASGPCTLMAPTMSRLTLPTNTMRAMSSVSASVTRRPLRNSGALPSRSIREPICGPPPWTTTVRMPTDRMRATSWAKEARSPDTAPPYFTTTTLPQKRRM